LQIFFEMLHLKHRHRLFCCTFHSRMRHLRHVECTPGAQNAAPGGYHRGAAGTDGTAQMTAQAFEISSLEDLERVTASVGLVGPRTGPDKRTKEQMEWYVLRQFLEKAIPATIFKLPIAGRKGCPPDEPDFVLMRPETTDVIGLVEITEATDEADQREMTEFERSGERMALLGHSGGRFPRGAARPGLAWASDIIDAIKRKETKVIFKSSLTPRHLIIYPNSSASKLLGDQLGVKRAKTSGKRLVTCVRQ
jgi:hypothetical protein